MPTIVPHLLIPVENNGSDGLAVHQNSSENLVNSVTSDHGAVIVAGVERPSSGDVGESAVGPSNQADVASRTSMAIPNYCTEIVNSERLEEYRRSIGRRDVCL